MKYVKQKSRAYGYEKVKTNVIIKLLELFHAKKVFIEIFNVSTDSIFCKNILQQKSKYVSFPDSSDKTYMDIVISENMSEDFPNISNNIIDSGSEIISLCLSDLSLEDFIHYNKKIFADKRITKKIINCAIDILFDENVLTVSFNSELFCQSDLLSKIDEIVLEMG